MPGIKELEYFRNELSKLGREREITEERGDSYELLPLPVAGAASVPSIDVDNLLASLGESSSPESSGEISLPGETPAEAASLDDLAGPVFPGTETPSSDMSAFDDLLANLQLDSPGPDVDVPDLGSADSSPEESFTVPEDLLAGFADDVEESRKAQDASPDFTFEEPVTPAMEKASGTDAAGEFGDFGELAALDDLGELGELGELGDSTSAPGSDAPVDAIAGLDALLAAGLPETPEVPDLGEMPGMPDISAGSDSAVGAGSFDIPEIPEIPDIGGETSPGAMDFTPSFEMDITPINDEYSGPPPGRKPDTRVDFADILADSEEKPTEPPANPMGEEFAGFSVPDDLSIPEPETAGPADIDGFDGFSLDEDFLKESAEAAVGDEEFHIPGFSDFTSGAARASVSELPPIGGAPRRGGKKEIPLRISEDDFRRFMELFSGFPLNLRIAIEEFISGETGTELQKMELVHSVLSQVSVRKIARNLEGLMDRSIPIPKDFEKKSVAQYEEEKASLRYIFINKILPAAVMFTIVAVLTACTVFLSWQFIYRPLAAESLYKRGYAAIEDARYTQSLDFFNQAVEVWEKKRWYFRYANAYRKKKQYISAEQMYERLLNRYDNDLAAGLEYAGMLRTELRNFEKAETVLRRRVLDNHVNDRDGLMLLGDNYLDWAEEQPEKYEEARKVYASLLELYGRKDPYLAGMMRYFIRTDNLAEVLPLKDHFMKRGAKLSAGDLVELSGFLLGRRYEPRPGDSEGLRGRIEDVRSLLERAVRADPAIPEAHYNMGRFFIYNYRSDLAAQALSEALRLFDLAETMSPRRILTRIDSFRLLGEVRSGEKEYLKAQALYAQGITLYEAQRENRGVRPDSRVGRLYADYADIDYFISNDLEAALVNYAKAVEELGDTPSIRYRIGYIQYQMQDFLSAMQSFSLTYARAPEDRNVAYSFANVLFRRGDLFASQGHYERLMEYLDAERLRKGIVFPQARLDHASFVEEYMRTSNNLGVTLSRLAGRTGDSRKNARALALLSESARAWDTLTRNPETLVRAQGTNLAVLNIRNMTHPRPDFQPEIYADIPKTLEGEAVLQQREDR